MRVSINGSSLSLVAKNCSRLTPGNESNAPARAIDSMLFLLQEESGIRSTKLNISENCPFASRSSMMLFTAPFPTPLIAAKPNLRSFSLFTENLKKDSLTSGLNTFMPMARHSSMNFVISVMLFRLLDNTAAIYSDGKLAFR